MTEQPRHPLLAPVKPDKRFFLPDGTAITSLKELAERMPKIPETMFKNHVNATKNDFHNWISHVIRDTHLSKEMKDIKDQLKLSRLLSKRVSELEARDARRQISQAIFTQQNQRTISAPRTIKQPSTSFPEPNQVPINPPPQGFSPTTPILPASRSGLQPLTTQKRNRPTIAPTHLSSTVGGSSSTVREDQGIVDKPNPPETTSIRRRVGSKQPASFGFGEGGTNSERPSEPEIPTIPALHEDIPIPPAAYYAPQESDTHSVWPSTESCDHTKHFSCMRCGMLEFGIGLTIGIITTLMFAKAFL